jgi:hypothetical protein
VGLGQLSFDARADSSSQLVDRKRCVENQETLGLCFGEREETCPHAGMELSFSFSPRRSRLIRIVETGAGKVFIEVE